MQIQGRNVGFHDSAFNITGIQFPGHMQHTGSTLSAALEPGFIQTLKHCFPGLSRTCKDQIPVFSRTQNTTGLWALPVGFRAECQKIGNLVQLETSQKCQIKYFSLLQTCGVSYNVHIIPGTRRDAGRKISRTTTLEFQDFSRLFQDLCLFPGPSRLGNHNF